MGVKTALVVFVLLFSGASSGQDTLISVTEKLGNFYVPISSEWTISPMSNNIYHVFEHRNSGAFVKIKVDQVSIQNSQEFNQHILRYINDLRSSKEFVELRKQNVPIKLLSLKGSHFMKIKSQSDLSVKFVYNPLVDKKLYHIEVIEKKSGNEPSEEVIRFLSTISLQPLSAVDVASTKAKDELRPEEKSDPAENTDGLSSFKKVKSDGRDKPANARNDASEKKEDVKKPDASAATYADKVILPPADIVKGNIPKVKFEVSNPCKNTGDAKGLPWEGYPGNAKGISYADNDAVQVPVIADFKNISNLSYNAAVSSSFEMMRILYGTMSEAEYKEFEAVWTPLFDYPDQKVIDYLNQLNPLVLQFLSLRESYTRIISDIQLLLLDAAYAVENNDKGAWESIMGEAKVNSLPLKHLEENMVLLAERIKELGNPPNPNEAKCEARKRYKKMLAPEEEECSNDLIGIWIGYSEGYSDLEFYEKQAECMVIYEMPMENPFANKLVCMDEIYSLAEEPRGQMGSYRYCDCDKPVIGGYSSTIFENALSVDKNKLQVTIDGIFYYFERASDQVLKPGPGLDEARVAELGEKVKAWEQRLKKLDQFANREEYENTKSQMESCKSVIKRLQYKQKMIPIFHAVSKEWLNNLPLSLTKWRASPGGDERMNLFKEMMNGKQGALKDAGTEEDEKVADEASARKAEEELEMQNRQEAIEFHAEIINLIQSNLEKDINERKEILIQMQQAKSPGELKAHGDRLKMIEMNIISKEANLQAEQDLIDSYKSGQLVHNRTVFDDVARNQFIQNIRENSSRMDATRRISERLERQIKLLPEELRAETRTRVLKNLDAKVIVSGDIEKARQISDAINEQVQGYAEYDHASAKEAEVNAEENKFYSDLAIMTVGAVSTGFASAALVETYGAGTAITVYGTKMLGAIYGGTTGLVAGGPAEGVSQAVAYWSPLGNSLVQFVDGYQNAGSNEEGDKLWNGIKNAGTGYLMGKAFEIGTSLAVKGSFVVFGKESQLFKPGIGLTKDRSQNVLDAIRSKQKSLHTDDEIATFKKLEAELAQLKGKDPILHGGEIAGKEIQLQKLAAGMNASYDAKWSLKYIQDPLTRAKFDRRVQQNYNQMIPGMVKNLEAKGYVMKDIEFIQFRNHNSGGTSSMDLDLGPVMRGSKSEPLVFYKKGGNIVDKEIFMNDAQKAMADEYYKLFGINAKMSDMNLVTSRHPEAFASSRLLGHNIDVGSFTASELSSIGKVLDVKMTGITINKMLTNTNKIQALCRETSKEVENFLLKKLASDLEKAPKGSQQQKNIKEKIQYWEYLLTKLKKIGTEENNAMKIIEANRELMMQTGGKDVIGIVKDVIKSFGHKPK